MRIAVLVTALSLPGLAFACGGSKTAANTATETNEVAKVDLASCAKKAELVGSACSYSTGMMAQRVLDKGTEFSFVGTLAESNDKAPSNVATPWIVAGNIHVIANQLADKVDPASRLSISGKTMEIDGVTYLVMTEVKSVQS